MSVARYQLIILSSAASLLSVNAYVTLIIPFSGADKTGFSDNTGASNILGVTVKCNTFFIPLATVATRQPFLLSNVELSPFTITVPSSCGSITSVSSSVLHVTVLSLPPRTTGVT